MKRWLFLCMMAFLLLALSKENVSADTMHYFENPKDVIAQFEDEIYHPEFKPKYAFLTEEVPVYTDHFGSEEQGKAEKYTGIIAVSKTKNYMQVIYEIQKGYNIGFIERILYDEHAKLYNGEEKQVLAAGTYTMESYSKDRCFYLDLIFDGDRQYYVRSPKTEGYLDIHYNEEGQPDGLYWNKEKSGDSQRWELLREYDHFYLKNKATGRYLMTKNEKGMGLYEGLQEITHVFSDEELKQGPEEVWWVFTRKYDKNVDPYRNFLQYDPDWGSEEYGEVNGDYGGRMAAAGCGVVVISNAVYALNGQFIDPMTLADFAVKEEYRIVGSGTDNEVFQAAAREFGDAYDFHYIKKTYDIFEVKKYLKQGCVAISHVPGHYVSIVDYDMDTSEYLVLDSHPIPKRPTTPFGDWFPWERLESGGLASSCYYIYSSMTKEELKHEFSK